ncbi:MAG: 2-oxo acid dehydrogenase subunit E2 [Bdellovibrionota bacterium]
MAATPKSKNPRFLGPNVILKPPLRLSPWRKIAMGTWRDAKDPSVYGILELDSEKALQFIDKLKRETGARITLTHLVGKIMAETLARHPEINCVLRWGKLYPRQNVDVFFQVATDAEGEDLSGMTVRNADRKSLAQIATEMNERVQAIKQKKDRTFDQTKTMMGLLPGFLAGLMIDFISLITYSLNLWSPAMGSPRDPFGSMMVTNIGSLGLDTAFAPLVPYSKVPVLIAVGESKLRPWVVDGQLAVRPILRLCATFDHRLIDGVHASHMSRTVQKIFADPERELTRLT